MSRTTRGNASSEDSSPPWYRCRHGHSGHAKAQVKHGDQAGPLVSRPAFVPQTTSPRHGAGRGLSPPAAPRRRHSLPSPVVFAHMFLATTRLGPLRRRRPMLPQGIAAEDVGHPMRAQVDPRGAHDHHSERLHEEDDRDTGLRAELAVGEIHTTSGDGAGWCVLTNCPRPPSSPPWPACWEPRLRSLRAAERTRERSDRAVCLGAARRTGGELAMTRVRL